MFRGQCAACHTREGARAMETLLKGRDEQSIRNVMVTLHEYKQDSPYRAFMPPLVGSETEIEALVQYLRTMSGPGEAAPPTKAVAKVE